MKAEEILASMGLRLPEPMEPLANYVTAVREGSLLYTSGASCFVDGKLKSLLKCGNRGAKG